jgi:hypothetical protein
MKLRKEANMKKDDETLKPLQNDKNHPLKTRRDFLAQGLLASTAALLLPFDVHAQEGCEVGPVVAVDNPMIPAIVVDLSGGAAIAGSNVIAGKANGQLDHLHAMGSGTGYRSLGLTDAENPANAGMISDLRGNTTNPQGLLFHARSGLLAGIREAAPQAALQNTDGVLMCGMSGDDTANNPHNPLYWFYKAGSRGNLSQLVGTESGRTGGRSRAPASSLDLGAAPVRIRGENDVSGLVSMGFHTNSGGSWLSRMSLQKSLINTIDRINSSYVGSLPRRKMASSIKDAVLCNSKKTEGLLGQYTSNQILPSLDTAISTAFGTDFRGQQASVAKMVLDGLAAAGTISIGGFDYHNSPRTNTDQRDRDAGRLIGRLIHAAHLKNKPLVIYLISDGSVSSNGQIEDGGRLRFTSDSGNRGSSVMIVYNPGGRPQMRTTSRQMGHFRENGGVDTNASPMSNNVTNLAKSVVLNYLALHGQEGRIKEIVGDNPFEQSMARHLFFTKIA